MGQLFPADHSLYPGDTLVLHVSTAAASFRVDFYRQGSTLQFQWSSDARDGDFAPDHGPDEDWTVDGNAVGGGPAKGWTGHSFVIPSDLPSGAYVAVLIEDLSLAAPPTLPTSWARTGRALFVLKNASTPAPILYKLPFFTYQSYNAVDGKQQSLYAGSVSCSIRRPGGGTGGIPWDQWNHDPYDLPFDINDPSKDGSPRSTFPHWDEKLIAWLEIGGYSVDYCTDLDVHTGALSLLPYALVLSAGHDEYYSTEMRDALEGYVAQGGNIAFLSGNVSFRPIALNGTLLRRPYLFPGTVEGVGWSVPPPDGPGRPENALTGVGWRNGGEPDGPRTVDFVCQYTDRWPFENTRLSDRDGFGGAQGIMGYECDGALFDRSLDQFPVLPTHTDGTPDEFVILGVGDIKIDGIDFKGNGAVTMGMYTRNGTVFTGGTTDWPRVVSQGEPRTVAITTNVLNRLGGAPKGLAPLATFGGVVAGDGFFSSDDNYRHAIVATDDGNLSELFFNPETGQGQTVLANLAGLADVAAFFTPDDNYRHVIAATNDGDIWEIFYNPNAGQGQTVLGNFPGVTRVAGYYTDDDQWRHVVIATSDGNVSELFYHPQHGQGQVVLGNFVGIVDVAGFFSPDDGYRHAMVATADGSIWELFYLPGSAGGQAVVGSFPAVSRISAFWAGDDAFFPRRVVIACADGRTHELRLQPGFAPLRSVVANNGPLADVGGFFSSDDGYRHAVMIDVSGNLQELFYRP
jgi:hypothetical protein